MTGGSVNGAGGAPALPSEADTVVIGAGPAGLGAAAVLARRGVRPLVIERDAVGASWRRRYDRLRLNTVRWLSNLPYMRIPRTSGRWPTRDEYVAYLERYAERVAPPVVTGVAARRVERTPTGWLVQTSSGPVRARFVVVATGLDGSPFLPDWPGADGFAGRLVHASEYRNAAPYRGRRVLVVGIGNSGVEISVELLERGAASVEVSLRTPANIFRREILGIPVTLLSVIAGRLPDRVTDALGYGIQRLLWGDLEPYGIGRAPLGLATELQVKRMGPVADCGFVAAVKDGRIRLVPPVERFDGPEVVLAGGRRIAPDDVIAATGYRRGLEPLVGHLGVLDARGWPLVTGGRCHPNAPGLYFNGYRVPLVGQLPGLRRTSREIASAVARERRAPRRVPSPARTRSRRRAAEVVQRS